jgi:hypothetical protein
MKGKSECRWKKKSRLLSLENVVYESVNAGRKRYWVGATIDQCSEDKVSRR